MFGGFQKLLVVSLHTIWYTYIGYQGLSRDYRKHCRIKCLLIWASIVGLVGGLGCTALCNSYNEEMVRWAEIILKLVSWFPCCAPNPTLSRSQTRGTELIPMPGQFSILKTQRMCLQGKGGGTGKRPWNMRGLGICGAAPPWTWHLEQSNLNYFNNDFKLLNISAG